MAILAIIVGLAALIWGANRFVSSASTLASLFQVSPLLIGIVIIGFGTSAPELLVSSLAAWEGSPDLAVANVLGSNILNIGFILGLTALLSPIRVKSDVVRKEIPFLFVCECLIGWQLFDLRITRFEALALISVFAAFMLYSIRRSSKSLNDSLADDVQHSLTATNFSKVSLWLFLVLGLASLLIGSRILVWGAVNVASLLGVSELVIGLTIVALGTSLPELTTSVIAALRKQPDLAIGNVIGSNIFNLLVVLGSATLITPMTSIASDFLYREWPTMMFFTVVLAAVCFKKKGDGCITRLEGTLLVILALLYNAIVLST